MRNPKNTMVWSYFGATPDASGEAWGSPAPQLPGFQLPGSPALLKPLKNPKNTMVWKLLGLNRLKKP